MEVYILEDPIDTSPSRQPEQPTDFRFDFNNIVLIIQLSHPELSL